MTCVLKTWNKKHLGCLYLLDSYINCPRGCLLNPLPQIMRHIFLDLSERNFMLYIQLERCYLWSLVMVDLYIWLIASLFSKFYFASMLYLFHGFLGKIFLFWNPCYYPKPRYLLSMSNNFDSVMSLIFLGRRERGLENRRYTYL